MKAFAHISTDLVTNRHVPQDPGLSSRHHGNIHDDVGEDMSLSNGMKARAFCSFHLQWYMAYISDVFIHILQSHCAWFSKIISHYQRESGDWANSCGHLDFESAVTAQNDEFKTRVELAWGGRTVENLARVGIIFELDKIQANSSQVGGQTIYQTPSKLWTWLELACVGRTVWPRF